MPQSLLAVSFVTTDLAESGVDLIVGFAIAPTGDPMGVNNLILMRAPKYEGLLPPEERGVLVTYDGSDEEERGYLRAVTLGEGEAHIQTGSCLYALDLSEVDPAEIDLMSKVLKKMNFDGSLRIMGI